MVAQTWLEAATYPQTTDAQAVVAELKREGFEEPDISVVYTDAGHIIQAGMISGALWGGVLGALVGSLFGTGWAHRRPYSPGNDSRDRHASG